MGEPIRGQIFDWEYALYSDSHITASYHDGYNGVNLYLYLPKTTYGEENGAVYIKPVGGNVLKMNLLRMTQMHNVMLECLQLLNKTCVEHPELKLPENI